MAVILAPFILIITFAHRCYRSPEGGNVSIWGESRQSLSWFVNQMQGSWPSMKASGKQEEEKRDGMRRSASSVKGKSPEFIEDERLC
jgi:hypothetical protein